MFGRKRKQRKKSHFHLSEKELESYINQFKLDQEYGNKGIAGVGTNGVQQAQSAPESGANAQGGNGQNAGRATAKTPFETYEEILALGTNAPADPVGVAVESIKANGTVTNKQAQDILNSSKALQTLREQVGLELPETASGRRNAVKAAVARLAELTAADTSSAQSDANEQSGAKEHISMADFANRESPVWRNVEYSDDATKASIMQDTHDTMVKEGAVVRVSDEVANSVDRAYPDLRSMKKKERTPILKSAMTRLKTDLRQFLNSFKNQSFEFEVNGKILDATLYSTGINEVLEKVTKEKANMLYSTESIFNNARYLYSTPDYDGDPNVYRWNYFYTPVQIGDDTVGVRIAVRDLVKQGESQIYNWGIKKDAPLGGVRDDSKNRKPYGASSDASNNNIPQTEPGVKPGNPTGSAPDFFAQLQAMARGEDTAQPQGNYADDIIAMANGTYQPQNAEVDTAAQSNYDNINKQGGVVNGTGEETQTVYSRGTEGAFGVQGKTRAEASGRSGVQEILGEAKERSPQAVSNQEDVGLNDKPLLYDRAYHITPESGSPLEDVQRSFTQDYGIECYIINDSAWREKDPACSRHGRVYIQESIDAATLSTAVPHESTHAMGQLGFSPYMEFFPVVQDSIISDTENGQKLLYLAGTQCGVDPLAISTDAEYYRLYSELNAIVYGLERAGIINNPNYEFGYIPSAFHNYSSYIAELDSIHEQYRQLVRQERAADSVETANPSVGADSSVGAAPAGFDANTHMQYQHGTLPSGENPVRSDDLPVSTDGNNRVSQTAVTVKGAKVTPDEFADLLTDDVTENNGMTYIPITNNATVQKAMDHITKEGWEAAKAKWQADVHAGKTGADMSAVGALLLNNAAKAGDKTGWLDILHDYQLMGTNTAQGLQALREIMLPHFDSERARYKTCHCEPVHTLVWQSVLSNVTITTQTQIKT